MNVNFIANIFFVMSGFAIAYRKSLTTKSRLKIEPISVRSDCTSGANNGSLLNVHYTGLFTNGTKFDSSYDRNKTLEFILGECPVTLIKGWVEGLQGMCTGEEAKWTIPPNLGYGSNGKGDIPGNTTLLFYVTVVDVDKNPSEEKLSEIKTMFNCTNVIS